MNIADSKGTVNVAINTSHSNEEQESIEGSKDSEDSNKTLPELPTSLSLLQEYYFKRELIRLQIDYEVNQLYDFKNIGLFGPPFTAREEGTVKLQDGYIEFPILRHVFVNRILTFPFLKDVDQHKFWNEKVQTFLESFAEKDISSSADRTEETKRRKAGIKLKKLIYIYMASGIRTTRDGDKLVDPSKSLYTGVQTVDQTQASFNISEGHFINGVDVNVCGVRMVSVRRGFLYDKTAEFFIRSQLEGGAPPIFVGRNFSDFRKLEAQLHKQFPTKILPRIPLKNNSSTFANGTDFTSDELNDDFDHDTDAYDEEEFDDSSEKSFSEKSIVQGPSKLFGIGKRSQNRPSKIIREKQRVTLRAYLRSLLKIPSVAKSTIILEFLFKDRIHRFNQNELNDIELRKKIDIVRMQDQVRFLKIATERARNLETHIAEFKSDISKPGGLKALFAEIKQKETMKDLSPKYQKFLDWVRVGFSASLFHIFVSGDQAPELFSQVRRVHGLMPYTVIRGLTKLSNPVSILKGKLRLCCRSYLSNKGFIDLFLAQPFGARSLLQSIFYMILADDIKAQERVIVALKKKIDNPEIIDVLNTFVESSPEYREELRLRADSENTDIIVALFEASKDRGNVSQSLVNALEKWHKLWNEAVEGDKIAELSEYVEKYSEIKDLLKLLIRQRDKDKVQQLWAEPSTILVIREVVTAFYSPLIQVFKTANISEALSDFERFMDDLIKVVGRAETMTLHSDPNQLVEEFISLCKRHEQSLYRFIHNIYSKDSGLFDEIIDWIGNIIEYLRQGSPRRLDLTGIYESCEVNGNLDPNKILQELNLIADYFKSRKAWRDEKIKTKKKGLDEMELNWQNAAPSGNIDGSDFGISNNDLDELDAEVNYSDDDDDEFNGENTENDHLNAFELEKKRREALLKKLDLNSSAPQRPDIIEIVKLRPIFHQHIISIMRGDT